MKTIKKIILGCAVATACFLQVSHAQAQEFTVQADLINRYVWRGFYQGGGASIQPTLGFGIGNFSLTAWGSTNFNGDSKEIDLTADYQFGEAGPTLSVASLWWAGENSFKYFNFESHQTAHHFEASLSYILPCEQFPLSVSWYTMFAGSDKRLDSKGEIKQNFTSYAELNLPFTVKTVELNATVGMLPYGQGFNNPDVDGNRSGIYASTKEINKFAVTNVALKATQEIKVTKSFSVPVFAQAVWNPCIEDAQLVFGITLRP